MLGEMTFILYYIWYNETIYHDVKKYFTVILNKIQIQNLALDITSEEKKFSFQVAMHYPWT